MHVSGLAAFNFTYYNFWGYSKWYVIFTNDLGTKDLLQMVCVCVCFFTPEWLNIENKPMSVPAVFGWGRDISQNTLYTGEAVETKCRPMIRGASWCCSDRMPVLKVEQGLNRKHILDVRDGSLQQCWSSPIILDCKVCRDTKHQSVCVHLYVCIVLVHKPN